MIVDVSAFIEQLANDMNNPDAAVPSEVRDAAPLLEEHMAKALEHFKRAPADAHLDVGRHLLSHYYGELMTIRFKAWIHANYTIGNDDSIHYGKEGGEGVVDVAGR